MASAPRDRAVGGRPTDATYSYDSLSRRTGRIASLDLDGAGTTQETVTDTWLFDPPSIAGKGQLYQSSRSVYYPSPGVSKLERRSTHEYDALARRTRTVVEQRLPEDTLETLATAMVYDANYGRPKAEVYPSGDVRWLQYSRYGHLNRETSLGGSIYWVTQSVNARGQPTQAMQGPLTRTATYDAASGQVTSIRYANGPTTLRQLNYAYDVYDNVATAQLGGGTTTETYTYDKLLRLTSATRSGGVTGSVSYAYDEAGSFRYKSDQSTVTTAAPHAYRYGTGNQGGVNDAGPHAVTQVSLSAAYGGGTRSLYYDDAGNLTNASNTGSSLGADAFGARYDHDQLPVFLNRGSSTVLSYGPDGERTRQTSAEGNWTWVGAFERSVVGTASERRVYLGNHTQLSTRTGTTGVQVSYLLTDRLGSVDAIADATGTLRETRGYDAFGKPRQGTWADANTLPSIARTTKGFTQHVHLDGARLIHMNGRAYDYQLGRFLSVDPVIQFPTNSQSLNPYSYILNNPLSGTDPTGFKSAFGSLCSHASNFTSSGTCGNGLAVINNLEAGGRDRDSSSKSSPENGGIPGNGPRGAGSGFVRSGAADIGRARSVDMHSPGMDDTTVLPQVPAVMPTQAELSSYDNDILQQQFRQAIRDLAFQQFKQEQGRAVRGFVVNIAVTAATFAVAPEILVVKAFGLLRRAEQAGEIGKAVMGASDAARGATQLTGQIHHGISRTVHKALDAHPNLRGVYSARDPRFVTQAKDLAAHRGYDTFHRNLDAEVAGWVRSNPNATPAQFESYLRGVYQRPDVLERFPNGL